MNRRDLFKYAGAAGALGLLSRGLRAAPSPLAKKKLLMVLAQGGWDTTYALDPKTQSAKVDVPVGNRRTFGNLDVFVDASRPNVTSYFTKYADVTAIVRGISVASVAHQECVKRMATGTRNEENADMGAIVAHDNGNDRPLPYLILGDTAFAGPYAVSAGRVGATNQIIALLDPAQSYQTNGRAPFVTTNAEDGQPVTLAFNNAATPASVTTLPTVNASGGSATFGVPLSPDATYQVVVTCRNANGVTGTSALTNFPVDTTAPDLTVTQPISGQFFGPTMLDSQGRFSVCGRTSSTDAAG
jgi:hypothetical protein